jgi:ComEC/Rec2-related protein
MPLSHLRRPLIVAAAFVVLVCAAFNRLGYLRPPLPLAWSYFADLPEVVVTGQLVSGYVDRRAGRRYWFLLDRVDGRRLPSVRVLVYVKHRLAVVLQPGMRVELRGRLRRPRVAWWPGAFNESRFVNQRGAVLILHARDARVTAHSPWQWWPWVWGDNLHRRLDQYFRETYDADSAGVLMGLLVGYKGALRSRTARQVQDAGVMHLLTPSGAKITLLIGWLVLCGYAVGLPPAWRVFGAIAVGGMYLCVVGPEPPYTRAYGMAVATAVAWWVGRGCGGVQGLAVAALVTLAVDPRAVASAGFLLSYSAMAAILLIAPRWPPPRHWPGALRIVIQGMILCVIVQCALWPLFAGIFGRGSIGGFLVNLLLVPMSGPLSVVGWGAYLIGGPFAAAAQWGAHVFLSVCRMAVGWSGCAVDLTPPPALLVLAYYAGSGALLLRGAGRVRVGLLVIAVIAFCGAHWPSQQPLELLAFADKGGIGLAVRLPGSHWFGVDLGARARTWRAVRQREGLKRAPLALWQTPGQAQISDLNLRWGAWGLSVVRGGKPLFCIINSSTGEAYRNCPERHRLNLLGQGPVRVIQSEENCEIRLRQARDYLGCVVS